MTTKPGDAEVNKASIGHVERKDPRSDDAHCEETQVDETIVAAADQDEKEGLTTAEAIVSDKLRIDGVRPDLIGSNELAIDRGECDNVEIEKKQGSDSEAREVGSFKKQFDNPEVDKVVFDRGRNYEYAPFSRPTEIRVALLVPSTNSDVPLHFYFEQGCLEDLEGSYEAISYIWGEPILEFPVYDVWTGARLMVTQNLHSALQQFRLKTSVRWLWADALCIDQKNDQEKARQIPLMVDIFRGAKRVLAWLHEADEAIQRGMRLIDQECFFDREATTHPKAYHNENGTSDKLNIDVMKVLDLSYFKRLWIVQELVFASEIVLHCGEVEFKWYRLKCALFSLKSGSLTFARSLPLTLQALQRVVDLRNSHARHSLHMSGRPKITHILKLVSEFCNYECTDVRDRVFAVHALSLGHNSGVIVDYTSDTRTVYCRFALACSMDGHMENVLIQALKRSSPMASADWPSWVPDWRQQLNSHHGQYNCLPKIQYVDKVGSDVVKVDISCIRPSTWQTAISEDHLRLARITHKVNSDCLISFRKFVRRAMETYLSICKEDEPEVNELWRILKYLMAPGLTLAESSELRLYLDTLWQDGMESATISAEVPQYYAVLDRPAADVTGGNIFFEAKIRGCPRTCLCYGPEDTTEADILAVIGRDMAFCGNSMYIYQALLLRSTKTAGIPTREDQNHEKLLYRAAGMVYVGFPIADLFEASEQHHATWITWNVRLNLC